MRVIAGAARGRRLVSPVGHGTRPTADRVKEAVFSKLGERVLAGPVLDLYAGSGALGIEALSRGAPRAVFVEEERQALRVLRENLQRTGLMAQSVVLGLPVEAALPRLVRQGAAFTLVLADPPYRRGLGMRLLADRSLRHLLAPHGVFVLEHEAGAAPAGAGWRLCGRARYGDTEVSFYEEEERAGDLPGHL